MRKTKAYLTSAEAAQELERKAREDEDAAVASQRRQESLFTSKPKDSWIQFSQAERNRHIANFEREMYEVFGQFPKANWMR